MNTHHMHNIVWAALNAAASEPIDQERQQRDYLAEALKNGDIGALDRAPRYIAAQGTAYPWKLMYEIQRAEGGMIEAARQVLKTAHEEIANPIPDSDDDLAGAIERAEAEARRNGFRKFIATAEKLLSLLDD